MFAHRGAYAPQEPNFTGLFRLINDFDRYSQQGGGHPHFYRGPTTPTFTPKFDLKETDANYELHGELPGIAKENLHIEFSDPQTVVVRGKVERVRASGTPPAGGLLENGQMSGAIAETGEQQHSADEQSGADDASSQKWHKVTIEDENEDGTTSSTAENTPATTVAEVAKPGAAAEKPKSSAPKAKYWVSERSIGEFSRSFTFPSRVEAEHVSASLDNGILTVVVPKSKKHETHRIVIN